MPASASAVETGPVTRTPPARDLYIDRLRSIMTALVLLHHASITYGAPGGWFWNELHPSPTLTGLILTMFVSTNQAYFMGFFFLLAGYFTPRSLERKGYGRFLGDRFLRLGLPLLAFGFFLGPLTAAMVTSFEGRGFWSTFAYLWQHKEFINGPLWFTQALLMFSLAYCAWRAFFGTPRASKQQTPLPVPSYRWWLLAAIAIGAVALGIRQFVPTGVNVIGLQLGYFSSYIFLFAIGIAAWRHDWLRRLTWRNVRPWIVTLVIAWPLLYIDIVIGALRHATSNSSRMSQGAILYAFWEPFIAWGLIAGWLLFARNRMNAPSAFWNWADRRAYAVYIIHPPVLVGISLLLHELTAPALIKFALTGALTLVATWLIADPLVRLPGVRSVV